MSLGINVIRNKWRITDGAYEVKKKYFKNVDFSLWRNRYLLHYFSIFAHLCKICNCKGSIGLVHIECQEKWLSVNGHKNCDLCNYKFPVEMKKYINIQVRVPLHVICMTCSCTTIRTKKLENLCLQDYLKS